MLESYAAQNGFTNTVHYTDDGWSGANFERPSWKRLVADIEDGKVGCAIAVFVVLLVLATTQFGKKEMR